MEQVARRGKERIRAAETRITKEMATTKAVDENRAVREMVGRPPKEEKEVSDDKVISDNEQIRLDPYYAFNQYFREKDDKGFGNGSPG
ncbi:Phytosulfokines 5 [Hordeum vulgare]|nr:Phytosulfokines 5 [Hordeum vulgare]